MGSFDPVVNVQELALAAPQTTKLRAAKSDQLLDEPARP